MIENEAQLAAALDYIAKWADALEGMRRHEADQNGGVFPTIAAGPLHEIRANLEDARAFAHARRDMPALGGNGTDVDTIGLRELRASHTGIAV